MSSLTPRMMYFDETWNKLQPTIKAVLRLDCVDRATWNECFSAIYALCVAKPENLAERLYTETMVFLENHVKQLCEETKESNEKVLLMYHKCWEQYSKGADYMNCLYSYLNNARFTSKEEMKEGDLQSSMDDTKQLLEIRELAMEIWRELMIKPLLDKLIPMLFDQIKNDQEVIQGVINSFLHVGKYKKAPLTFYREILERFEYYKQEASNLQQESSCSRYMEKVLAQLKDEELLAFKNSQTVAYKEPQDSTQMDETELQKNMKYLLDINMLNQDPQKEEIESRSTFSLNMGFTGEMTNLKITTPMQKDIPQELEQMRSTVDEDRKMYLQAAILTIMKDRKVLRHNTLIQEVINQSKSRFKPSISMIKKCIEMLIGQEYIERSQSSADEYSYVAPKQEGPGPSTDVHPPTTH